MDIQEKYEQAKEFCQCYEDAQKYTECKEKYKKLFLLANSHSIFIPSEKEEYENYYKHLTDDNNIVITVDGQPL